MSTPQRGPPPRCPFPATPTSPSPDWRRAARCPASNKINAAFADGPDGLIQTIQNTFGIPISHYIAINFFGVMDAVNALGGIAWTSPTRCGTTTARHRRLHNKSGLDIPASGCQVLNGSQAPGPVAVALLPVLRQRQWISDPTSDIGRIQRQNLIISAAINRAKSTYNPLRLNALFTSVVHDFSKDDGLSPGDLFATGRALPRLLRLSTPAP